MGLVWLISGLCGEFTLSPIYPIRRRGSRLWCSVIFDFLGLRPQKSLAGNLSAY